VNGWMFFQVKVDKFLTPEQWKKLEENRRIEEEKRLREKGDNWRERGLDQMMGGVLEVKKEDELKKVHLLDISVQFSHARILLHTFFV